MGTLLGDDEKDLGMDSGDTVHSIVNVPNAIKGLKC